MNEYIAGAFILLGALLAVIAALGVLRLPDVLIRMHASTKVGTLSTGLVMVGCAIVFWDLGITVRAVAIMVFLLLTAPIAGHMIGRAAIETGVPLWRTRRAGEPEEPDAPT